MRPSVKDFAERFGIKYRGKADIPVPQFELDSRDVEPGKGFVAIKGRRVDGHDFVEEAIRKGARAIVVDSGMAERFNRYFDEAAFLYKEGETSEGCLRHIASVRSRDFRGKIIGITGSSGKTTVKEFIHQLLTKEKKTFKVRKSFNTPVSMSLELINADEQAEFWVVEYGARKQGDIKELMEIASPHWVVFTNIGFAHIGILGSRENIFREKSGLLDSEYLEKVFSVKEDEFSQAIKTKAAERNARTIEVSIESQADVWADGIELDEAARPSFSLHRGDEVRRIKTGFFGIHNVANFLLAAAVALEAGVSLDLVAAAAAGLIPPEKRMFMVEKDGIRYINDAYNSNPASLQAAFQTLKYMRTEGRKIAVIGDMLELGEYAPEFHRRAGMQAGEAGVDRVIYVGDYHKEFLLGYGMVEKFDRASDYLAAAEILKKLAQPGDLVLLKASRKFELDRVLEHV